MNKSKTITILLIVLIVFVAIFVITFLLFNRKQEGSFAFIKNSELILRSNGVDQNIGTVDSEGINLQVSNDQKYVLYSDNSSLVVWNVHDKSKKNFEINNKINSFAWGKDSNEIIYTNDEGLKILNINDSTSKIIYKNSDNDFIDLNTKITPNHDYSAFSLDFAGGETSVGGIIIDLAGNVNKSTKRCGTTQDWSSDNKFIIIAHKNAIGGCNGIYIVNVPDGKDIIENNDILFPESAKFYDHDKSVLIIEGNTVKKLNIQTNESRKTTDLVSTDMNILSKSIMYIDSEDSAFIFLRSNNRNQSKIFKIKSDGELSTQVEDIY